MRSLRVQLLLATGVGMAALLLASGAVLYTLLERALWAEFDQALASKARALATLIEEDEDGLESELESVATLEYGPAAGDAAEYYQVWLPNGSVFARSKSLESGDLSRFAGKLDAPEFRSTPLPDGKAGRLVGIEFAPRREEFDQRLGPAPTLTLVAARGTGGLAATLARVQLLLLGVGLAAIAVTAGGLAWVVRRQLAPLARLSAQIAGMGERDLHTRLDHARVPAELQPVVQRLNDMLSRLEAAFERERRFTGDVAHELRTPLAGLRITLETALSRPRTADACRGAMNDCLTVSLQMQRMVENLLHLARADAGQLHLRRERVDWAALTGECWDSVSQQAAARRVEVEWNLRASGEIETDRDAAQVITRNLLDNAAAHAPEGSVVRVMLDRDGAGGPSLTVQNDTSMTAGEAEHVFDRFWRADPSRQHVNGLHCGLGLPLCRALVRQLGGTIAADVSTGVFRIVVRFPPGVRTTPANVPVANA